MKKFLLLCAMLSAFAQGSGFMGGGGSGGGGSAVNAIMYDAGNSGSSKTIDWGNGAYQKLTLTADTTLTLSSPENTIYLLTLLQDSTGSRTVSWPATVRWAGGTALTTSTANKADVVQLAYDGSYYLASYATAFSHSNAYRSDHSITFNGSNENIDLGNTLDETGANPFSWSFWAKASASAGTAIGKISGTTQGYQIVMGSAFLAFQAGDGAGGHVLDLRKDPGLSANTWHHVVLTYDGTKSAAGTKFYIDGSVLGAYDTATDTLSSQSITTTDHLFIGDQTSPFPFNGKLDEVVRWDKVLSAGEVAEIYASDDLANVSVAGNRTAWWKLGESVGESASTSNGIKDSIGSRHGTAANMDASNITTDVH